MQLETVSQNLQLINGHFKTIYTHFFNNLGFVKDTYAVCEKPTTNGPTTAIYQLQILGNSLYVRLI